MSAVSVSCPLGSYFASHFIMGGEKFDSTHPEGYLFGENSDLNFLGNRPVAVCLRSIPFHVGPSAESNGLDISG